MSAQLIFSILTYISLIIGSNSEGNCGGCGSDNVNDYLSIEISNIRTTLHGVVYEPVYNFDGTWESAGECNDGYTYYYKTDVYNLVYEVDETFYLLYSSDENLWKIVKPSYSTAWAYCTSTDIEDCTNNWFVEYGYSGGIAYIQDTSVNTIGVTDNTCSDTVGTITTTPAPTEDESCYNNGNTCIKGSGWWYDDMNQYWEAESCHNNEIAYVCITCTDYDWKLFYNNDYWLIDWNIRDTSTIDTAVGHCNSEGETDVTNCNGNWDFVFSLDDGSTFSSDSTCNSRSDTSSATDTNDDTSDDEDWSIVPYGYDLIDSSDNNDDNSLEWWAWLLISLAIVAVIIVIVVVTIKICNNRKQKVQLNSADDDKNQYLLMSNDK